LYCFIAIIVLNAGMMLVYGLIGVEFFISIMLLTIFSLSVQSLGEETKLGSSLIFMAIVGGAIFPLIMGRVSDASNIQTAKVVPLACFVVVFFLFCVDIK